MRVHEIAKTLEVSSKEIVAFLKKEGADVKNHMSALDEDLIKKTEKKFGSKKKKAPAKTEKPSKEKKKTKEKAPSKKKTKKAAKPVVDPKVPGAKGISPTRKKVANI